MLGPPTQNNIAPCVQIAPASSMKSVGSLMRLVGGSCPGSGVAVNVTALSHTVGLRAQTASHHQRDPKS